MSKTSLSIEKLAIKNKSVDLHVKKGDDVKIIAGNDKGKSGKILRVFKKKLRVLVGGINMVKKVVEKPEGGKGFITIEYPVHVSNVKKISK